VNEGEVLQQVVLDGRTWTMINRIRRRRRFCKDQSRGFLLNVKCKTYPRGGRVACI
jgi:hypothetical protein